MNRRIYLDHAATSWPKPDCVLDAMDRYARQCGASAGRGTYRSANEAASVVLSVRREIARHIGAASPSSISLHPSGTAALNAAIHGLLRPGDHVVTTAAEHNSVLRPLHFQKQQQKIELVVVPSDSHGRVSTKDVLAAMTDRTRLVAVTHASNVTGTIQPIREIAQQLESHRAMLLCDAAQTFGYLPIDVASSGIDLLAAPGHKGGGGPLGTGFLYASPGCQRSLRPSIQGGTGSQSESLEMPCAYPEKLEPGNLNVPALAGWAAGLREAAEAKEVQRRLGDLSQRLHTGLARIPGLRIFGEADRLPIASVSLPGISPTDLSSILDIEYGIETRAGLHCAALIHSHLGNTADGTLRISGGRSTTDEEIDAVIEALATIASELAR